jgi:hypothetical protein
MAEPRPVGKIYDIPPQPPDAAHTRWIPAGVVTIGVEYRDVTPEALVETYRDDPDQLASLLAQSPDGGFWALECIRHRLPEMLPRAGGAALVDRLDRAALDAALDEVAPLATAAQAAHRSRA